MTYKKFLKGYGEALDVFSAENLFIWVYDASRASLSFSNPAPKTWGEACMQPTTLEGWLEAAEPNETEALKEKWRAILFSPDRGNDVEFFYRLRRRDGEPIWCLSRGTVVDRDNKGQAMYVSGVAIPLEGLAEKLEESILWRERASFALDAVRDGLWDWDGVTNEVYYSPRYLSMIGYNPEQFPSRLEAWSARVHADDLAHTHDYQTMIAESPAHGDSFECTYRMLAANGQYRWILGRGKVIERGPDGRATRIIGLHTDITELRQAQEALTAMVNHDTLTGLYSRLYFEQEFNSLTPDDYPVSVVYADLDSLKLVNDLMGHDAGDRLLIAAADLLRSAVRSSDIVARMGGDEFAVLMRRCGGSAARSIMRKIRRTPYMNLRDADSMPVYISLGAASTDEGLEAAHLVTRADQAMLRDKDHVRSGSRAKVTEWINARKAQGRAWDTF